MTKPVATLTPEDLQLSQELNDLEEANAKAYSTAINSVMSTYAKMCAEHHKSMMKLYEGFAAKYNFIIPDDADYYFRIEKSTGEVFCDRIAGETGSVN